MVGREDELGRLDAFLDLPDRRLRALILEGEAGVGKSTLWGAGVAAAEERGFKVLSSRPAEVERGFAHVVLADLLEGVAAEMLPALSRPRRHALESALLVDGMPEDALDPRALGVAVRACLQLIADERPLLLAVDDGQWLDASTAGALAFALRRLHDHRIVFLLARRVDDPGESRQVEGAFAVGAVERLRVTPLSIGAMHLLLQRRLGRPFARPTLRRLHEISGGNPFYAIELARALGSGEGDRLEPLPVPETLERLVGARLEGLTGATRQALLLTVAHGRPSPSLFDAVGISRTALEPAFAAHVLEISDGLVRFSHPLLASVLYQGVPEDERQLAHRRLAEVVDDPVERARHLALSSDTPDEDVAAALEAVADLPRARGSIVEAAELAEHALRLTPVEGLEDRQRRTIAAARAHLEAGDGRRAQALAELLDGATERARAEGLVLMSDIEGAGHHLERAIELRRDALKAAAGRPVLQAEIHEWLARFVQSTEGTCSATRHAMSALELADSLGDDALRAGALCALAFGRFWAGESDAPRLVEEALVAAAGADPRRRRVANLLAVFTAVWSSQLDRGRTLLEGIDREWGERDEIVRWQVLWWLTLIELRSGRLALAAEYAEQAGEIRRQYAADEREGRRVTWLAALIAAWRGDLPRARAVSDQPETESLARMFNRAMLGVVELWSGHPEEAAARFAAADVDRQGLGINEPALFWWCADWAEALLALGRLDEAAALVHAWEVDAARLGRLAVLAQAALCRGLVAAAQGELDNALAELERAVAQHEAVGDVFGRARALLALGVVRRRARQKRASREALAAALEIFEASGAAGWAEKARAELGRIGGRTRVEGLTPAERRIAALVAEGRTNREVAAALYLREHTVATALTRVYRKLGVRSRTELARLLAEETSEARPAKS